MVVCDYNYAFDPYVALADFSVEHDLSNVVLVIDEIHNLVERGRGYLSPELSSTSARRSAEAAAHGGSPVHRELERLSLALATLIEGDRGRRARRDRPSRKGRSRRRCPRSASGGCAPTSMPPSSTTSNTAARPGASRPTTPSSALYFELLRFLNGLAIEGGISSHLCERRGDERKLRIFCKDPGALPRPGDRSRALGDRPLGDA